MLSTALPSSPNLESTRFISRLISRFARNSRFFQNVPYFSRIFQISPDCFPDFSRIWKWLVRYVYYFLCCNMADQQQHPSCCLGLIISTSVFKFISTWPYGLSSQWHGLRQHHDRSKLPTDRHTHRSSQLIKAVCITKSTESIEIQHPSTSQALGQHNKNTTVFSIGEMSMLLYSSPLVHSVSKSTNSTMGLQC